MTNFNFLSNLLSLSLGSQSSDVSLDRRLTVGSPSGRYCSGLMRLVSVLAILLTVGVGQMWGADALVYTLDYYKTGSGTASSYTGTANFTSDGITWNVPGNQTTNPPRIGGAKNSSGTNVIRSIYSKTAISANISKITITHGAKSGITVNSVTLHVYSTAAKASTGGNGDVSDVSVSYVDNGIMTFNRPSGHNWTGRFYRIDYNLSWTSSSSSARYIQFDEANFYKTTYTMAYDANGGSGTMTDSSSPYNEGATVTVKSNGFTAPDGYTFDHWDTKSDDSGTDYDAGDSFTISANTTLYAQWAADATVNVTGVEVSPTSKAIVVGETFTITPTVAPANATDKSVSWSSNATSYATVSSGTVTGVAAGSATITCTTTDGSYTATCATTVYGVTIAVEDEDGTPLSGVGKPTISRSGAAVTTAAGNYVFKEWSVTNATLSGSTSTGTTITLPTGAVTVKAIYRKPINVTWKVGDGNASGGTTQVAYNTKITSLPTSPDDDDLGDCADTFMGWSGTNLGSNTGNSAPSDLFTSPSDAGVQALTSDKTYYAVFATAGSGSAGEKIKITPTNSSLPAAGKYNADETEFTIGDYSFRHNEWCKSADPPASYNIQAKKNNTYSVYNVDPFENLIDHIIVYQTGTNRDVTITGSYYYDSDEAEEAGDTFEEEEITAPSTAATMSFDFSGNDHRYFYMSTPGNAVYMDSIVIYTRNSKSYSDYVTLCCTDLASINGSVSWNSPTEAVVTWDKLDSQVSSWALSWSPNTTGSSITSAIADKGLTQKTATVSDLACGTAYTFTLTPTIKSGVCTPASNPTIESTSTKYAITLTNDGDITGGVFTSDPEEECASKIITLEAAPNTGYEFTNWEITYTDSGDDAWDDVNGDDDDLVSDEIVIEMPAADITVNAVFSCISTTVTVGPTTAAGNYGWRYTPGETIDLTCSTSGATPTGYQWQKYISSDWEDIDGATTARFQKSNCTSSDGGSYRCVVTTGTGCSFQSDGYFIRIFTFDGNYSGESWTKNAITWTGENTGTVTLSLDESSIYEFKVYDNDGKTFGNGTGNYIIQPVNWDCGTGNSNCRLFTGPEGNYTFTLNISHSGDNSPYVNVQVAYPSVTHPVEGYAYVSKWWDCYPHFWDGSGNALTPDGYDPQITTYTTICEVDYWYFPVLATYVNVAVKDNATWASAGNNSGNQTTTDHSGMYLTHDGSWGWHDFATYSITFAGNGNTGGSMSNVTGLCPGTNSALAENGYTKTGYHFDGWKTNVAITINTGGDDESIAVNGIVPDEATIKGIGSNITLTAQWAANTNTPYTVKHYKQKLDGTYPASADDTDNLTGTTGASITPDRKSYTGFTAPSGTTTTILADGSRVVEYQYSRNSYTLAWSLDGGEISVAGTTAGSVKYEASLTAPTVTKTGYTFSAWSPSVPSTMPAANSTYTATWTANTNTAYTVKHYKQKLDGTYDSTPDDTDNLTGTTGASITPDRKSYTGFTAPSGTTTTILADGSRVVEYQYTRNTYNVAVTLVDNVTITATPAGGSAIAEDNNADDVLYEKTVTLNYSSLISGLTFGGWKVTKTDDASVSVTVSGSGNGATFAMPAYAVNVTAIVYSVGIAWCVPEDMELEGNVHLTSTKDVYVHSTSLTLTSEDLGSATSIEVAYLNVDAADAEVAKESSLFRLYASNASETVDEIDVSAARTFEENYTLRYTPGAHGVTNNYKLQLTLKKGDIEMKKDTFEIYGRSLPEKFVIASKYLGNWYALPNTMGTAAETVTPLTITVDSVDDKPAQVLNAPATTLYKGAARKTTGSNVNSIRLTNDGSHWLITTNSDAKLGLSATETEGFENREVWYLKSSDFGAYELAMDPSQSPSKKLGIYNGYMGMYADPAYTSEDIYLLPIKYTVTYDDNGKTSGSVPTDDNTYNCGATVTVKGNTGSLAKTGYTFGGWNTQADGKGTNYTAGSGTFDMPEEGVTLYAKWVPAVLHFTGAQGYSWFDTRNWSPACIPTIEHDVIIENRAALYGPFTSGSDYDEGDYTTRHGKAKSIKIDKTASSNAKINIWSCASLIVAEGIKVKKEVDEVTLDDQPTTPEDLYIETNILGNGGLICGAASANTQVEYEFYSKSFKYGTFLVNQYVGIPFTSLDGDQLYSMNIFVYDDENDAWKTPESKTLEPFTAYNYINKHSLTWNVYHLTGTLALPGIEGEGRKKVLTCGSRFNAEGHFDGEKSFSEANGDYMFANSWTAPIDIASMTSADFSGTGGADMEQTIYIFNAGWLNPDPDAKKDIGDNAGQWTPFPIESAAGMDNAVIPATQAFCVTAKAANATLTLDYKKHVYDPATAVTVDSISNFPTRAPRRYKAAGTPVRLKMMVHKDSAIADNIYIFEREDFSYDFDNGWDGRKIFGKSLVPQLYTIRWNTNLAVDAVPEMDGTLIGFKAGTEANSYTFTFEYNGSEPLYLYDKDMNEFTQITNEATYTFTTDDTAEHQRFVLTRSKSPAVSTWLENVQDDDVQSTKVRKLLLDGNMYIIRGGRMYDATGRMVK